MIQFKYNAVAALSILMAIVASANPQERRQWSKERNVLSLEHIITGVSSLYLRRVDFAFDGGSLLFGLSLEESSPVEVFVFLPNPNVGGTVDGKQLVVVSNHSHLSRFAFAEQTDPGYQKFSKLMKDAGIGVSDELNDEGSLKRGRQLVNSVLETSKPPTKWGDAAIRKQEIGEDHLNGNMDDIFRITE